MIFHGFRSPVYVHCGSGLDADGTGVVYIANTDYCYICFTCQVLYVDFGNQDMVKSSMLVDIAPLMEVPIQAFAVRLANMVSPLSLSPGSGVYMLLKCVVCI